MAKLTQSTTGPAKRRRAGPAGMRAGDRRSIQVGVGATILVHLLLLWLAPRWQTDFIPFESAGPTYAERTFDIEMEPEMFAEPEEETLGQFVEVNPDAPENTPDQTDNFGAQNQQAAQEVPSPDGTSEAPAVEGQTEIETTSIVSGTRSEPTEAEPAPPPPPEVLQEIQEALEAAVEEAARQAQTPLPGFEEVEGKSEDSFGSSTVRLPENPQQVAEAIEGALESTQPQGASRGSFRVDPTRPAPRPSLSTSDLRPAFITERVEGTDRMGVVAHTALRTEYGAYLGRIIEAVDRQWSNSVRTGLQGGLSYPLAGSTVKVKFQLMKSGELSILEVDGTADTLWSRFCVDAIAQRAPYGVWTEDMIRVLGESQEITFTFHYQ